MEQPLQVVGIVPKGLEFSLNGDFHAALRFTIQDTREFGNTVLDVVGRLKPSRSLADGQASVGHLSWSRLGADSADVSGWRLGALRCASGAAVTLTMF